MDKYFIKEFRVKKLWGYRNMKISFNKDVNILIGRNASGKTTILNMLRYILTADVSKLYAVPFNEVFIKLKCFEGRDSVTIKVKSTNEGLECSVGEEEYYIDVESLRDRYIHPRFRNTRYRAVLDNYEQSVNSLVPTVWLPVSRRLPVSEGEERELRRRRDKGLESVDERLRELLEQLVVYRKTLDSELSKLHVEFQRRVFEIMLYSKKHDVYSSVKAEVLSEEQHDQLVRAFDAAGLLDTRMRKRIDEHFSAARQVVKRLDKSNGKEIVSFEDIFIIPLIQRTNSMVQFARELEDNRRKLFRPLEQYEEIFSLFLKEKRVRVSEDGELVIQSIAQTGQNLETHLLSSGEKQIVILLTQALLWQDKPVVYVADEPELSLHVSWQEKLLKSLQDLGGRIQIIVATHSPDIAGPFPNNVIDLEKA